jgi:hypothetical protein
MIMKQALSLFAIVVGVTIFGIFVYWAVINFDIVREGKILPYTDHDVYEVTIGGLVYFYVQPELRLSDDIITSVILLGACFISLTFASILISHGKSTRHVISFLLMLSAAMFYLAADESFGLHESLGHNMQFLAKIPGMTHPDDFIIVVYGFIFLFFLYYYRSVFINKRRPLLYYGAALVLVALAAISDAIEFPLEEVVEMLVVVCVFLGTMSLGLAIMEEEFFGEIAERADGRPGPCPVDQASPAEARPGR